MSLVSIRHHPQACSRRIAVSIARSAKYEDRCERGQNHQIALEPTSFLLHPRLPPSFAETLANWWLQQQRARGGDLLRRARRAMAVQQRIHGAWVHPRPVDRAARTGASLPSTGGVVPSPRHSTAPSVPVCDEVPHSNDSIPPTHPHHELNFSLSLYIDLI